MRAGLVIYGSLDTVSGGYLYDRQLVRTLRDDGDQVDIISIPWRSYPRHLADNWSAEWVRRMMDGYDVLLQDELNHPSLAWANGRLGAGRPPAVAIVHHLRSSENNPAWQKWIYRGVERRYLRSVDAFIYNSQTTRRAVETMIGGERPYVVAYPAGDRLVGGEYSAQPNSHQEDGPLRLLFVGNLIQRKGLHVLLDALRHVSADWRLRVVGNPAADPAYARRARVAAEAGGIAERVGWLGGLDDAQLRAELAAAQALVVPSDYEGFGIVYLEGMGFGLPAMATTGGAAGEIITHGENGFLVAPGDALALARHIESLARDRQLLARMSAAAWERYRRQPTWRQTTSAIRAFLLDMVRKEGS